MGRGDAVPPEARALLRDSPRAEPIPKAPETRRPACYDFYERTYRFGCGRPATWRVDGKNACLWHAWQLVRRG